MAASRGTQAATDLLQPKYVFPNPADQLLWRLECSCTARSTRQVQCHACAQGSSFPQIRGYILYDFAADFRLTSRTLFCALVFACVHLWQHACSPISQRCKPTMVVQSNDWFNIRTPHSMANMERCDVCRC